MRNVMLVGAISIALVFGLSALFNADQADAAPVVGSGSFSLAPSATEDAWDDTTASDVGVAITLTSGTIEVRGTVGTTTTTLATMSAGESAIFEGNYNTVTIFGTGGTAQGTYETRSPSDVTNSTDGLVGEITTTMSVSGTERVYYGDANRERSLLVEVVSGDIAIRTSATGSDLVSGTAGETIWTYDLTSTEWYVSGTGSVQFSSHQMNTNAAPPTESKKKSSGKDSTATINWPGTKCVTGKVSNTGGGDIQVRITYSGDPDTYDPPNNSEDEPQFHTLQEGEDHPFFCKVKSIELKFEKGAGEATVTHGAG